MAVTSLIPFTWLLLGIFFFNRLFGAVSGGLATRFSIDGPTIDFDDNVIYLDYIMSTFATEENLHYEFYNWDCKEKVGTDLSPLVADSLAKGKFYNMLDEEDRQQWKIPLTLKDRTKREQKVCFRWMIFTGPPSDPDSIEVNFSQTQLSISSAGGKISNVDASEKKVEGVRVILPGKKVKSNEIDNDELSAEL